MPLEIEPALIKRAQATEAGLEELIRLVWPEAYRIAVSVLRDPGLAEDAAQDACAAIARSLTTLKNIALFRAWSYKIIVNYAISTARRRPHTVTLEGQADRLIHIDSTDALDLDEALGKLPLQQRGAIILHYYAGLTSGEIAAAVKLPASTIRFHLMLARRALHKHLTETESRATPTKEVFSDVH